MEVEQAGAVGMEPAATEPAAAEPAESEEPAPVTLAWTNRQRVVMAPAEIKQDRAVVLLEGAAPVASPAAAVVEGEAAAPVGVVARSSLVHQINLPQVAPASDTLASARGVPSLGSIAVPQVPARKVRGALPDRGLTARRRHRPAVRQP